MRLLLQLFKQCKPRKPCTSAFGLGIERGMEFRGRPSQPACQSCNGPRTWIWNLKSRPNATEYASEISHHSSLCSGIGQPHPSSVQTLHTSHNQQDGMSWTQKRKSLSIQLIVNNISEGNPASLGSMTESLCASGAVSVHPTDNPYIRPV